MFACNREWLRLASCPIFLYEKTDNGRKKTDHRLHDFSALCTLPDMTPTAFKEAGVGNINLAEPSFYVQKGQEREGRRIQLRPIQWNRVKVKVDKETGGLLYYVDNSDKPQTRADILHIPGLTLDGYIGITPLEYAQSTLNIGISQDTFQQNFYQNGVMASGVFQFPGKFSDEAFQRLKKELKANYAGT